MLFNANFLAGTKEPSRSDGYLFITSVVFIYQDPLGALALYRIVGYPSVISI